MDWRSRYVLSWELSNTLDTSFCLRALERAFEKYGKPDIDIFNTDQGSQFTSKAFTGRLKEKGIRISMDSKGRCIDNVFIERLWRSLKYEEVYLHDYKNVLEARLNIGKYLKFYNEERLHQALNYNTPSEVYFSGQVDREAINC
jgi:putative transposase